MKKLLLVLALSLPLFGQSTTCGKNGSFTGTGSGVEIDNRTSNSPACVQWRLTYFSYGLSALSIEVDGAPDLAGTPGTYAAIGSTFVQQGSNPSTAIQSEVMIQAYYPWIKVKVTTYTTSSSPNKIWWNLTGVNSFVANQRGGSGSTGVKTWNTRTGDVVPLTGDYTAAQVTNAFDLSASNSLGAHAETSTEIATPAAPSAGAVKWYAKSGALCSLDSSSVERCMISTTQGVYYQTFEDEGTPVTQRSTVNFVGSGVSCADSGGKTVCTISGGAGGYATIQDEGTPLTQETTVNFTGSGITCTDDAGNSRTNCNVPGGVTQAYDTIQDEANDLTQRSKVNFTGAGVTCADDAGNSRTNCTITGTSNPFSGPFYNVSLLDDTSWTWLNQSGWTRSVTSGTLNLSNTTTTTGQRVTARYIAYPTAPFTRQTCFYMAGQTQSANVEPGIVLYDSSGGGAIIQTVTNIKKYTNSTSFSANYGSTVNWTGSTGVGGPLCLKFEDDSTNRKFYFSINNSDWVSMNTSTISRTDFITPDKIGVGVWSNTGTGFLMIQFMTWQ